MMVIRFFQPVPQLADHQVASVGGKFVLVDVVERRDPLVTGAGHARHRHGARHEPSPVGGVCIPQAQFRLVGLA